ncbi:MAG: lysine--tRNA ligase [Arenicellales bacterium]
MTSTEDNDQFAQRLAKLDAAKQNGTAYPNDFNRQDFAGDLSAKYGETSKEDLAEAAIEVSVAGRLMTRRMMGKASFVTIQDMNGRIQLFLQKNALGDEAYDEFKHLDIGDIVGINGTLFKTQTDELSVRVASIKLLTKALRPLPEKFHGLSDAETRYRQRYVDLIMNQDVRDIFEKRSASIQYIRNYLVERRYLEVETPMMHPIPGGAVARPFNTHHNTLDIPLFLRIAPELYLKRLVVGGFERVFEINRSFRNEGVSTRHNPEFTMLEFYQAYATFEDLMDLTEDMLRGLIIKITGSAMLTYQENELDFQSPFTRMTMVESILQFNPDLSLADVDNLESATKVAEGMKLLIKPSFGLGKVQTEIFEETVEHRLMNPTFITDYPVEVSPLSRRNDDRHEVSDRFEFFAAGREVANGFSELNDPIDQAERFKAQVADKDAGDDEAMHFDADYIRALEYGLPPTAGEGIGIDRLVMLLTDSASIREVLLFPLMRPEA